ncbi:hypothetical protein BCR36DRAFT_587230 [Piromyces finnis]|uniref:Uncharacterized protein n=1 Tax=Piromyces finnis TaxID=1754191 RepID=A0A1Y1UWG9_9FUNG|nr:hypothetical protein BCR36DRAFT_587230 [Piromyces finnis]|eukprot:ORX42411.1 hypothetical protein BCR36DRAFT_587230 [Piromyces finnis]
MKFIKKLLTILTTTSVFTYSIPVKRQEIELNINTNQKNIPDVQNFDLSQLSNIDLSYLGINTNEKCENSLINYKECLIGTIEIDQNNKDVICRTFNAEKCQHLFNNGMESLDGCKDLDDLLLKIKKFIVETNYVSLKMQCAKDESNQYCPLSSLSTQLINETSQQTSSNEEEVIKKYNDAVNATCKSKTCIDTTLEFENDFNKLKIEFEDFKNQVAGIIKLLGVTRDVPILDPRVKFTFTVEGVNQENILSKTSEYLKSGKCFFNEDNKSNATSFKLSDSILLVTIATVIFILV